MNYAALDSPMQRNSVLMDIAIQTPANHLVVFIGPPGIGKTSFLRAIAYARGVRPDHFLRWSVGQHGPEDFNGWPTPRPNGLVMEAPAAVRALNDGLPAVWFLDEFNLMLRSTQGGVLRVTDERFVGDEKLNDAVRLFGAMNPPEHAVDAHDLARPVANRGVWLPFVTPSKDDVAAYQMGHRTPPIILGPMGHDDWADARAEVAGIFVGFMQARGVLMEDFNDKEVKSRFPLAVATPRSWDYFLDFAATCRFHKDESAMLEFAVGSVGKPQGFEFMAYYKSADLMAPKDCIDNPKAFEVRPARPDRTFAQVTAVARYATEPRAGRDAIKVWNGAWSFIEHLVYDNGVPRALCLPAAQFLVRGKPKGDMDPSHEKTLKDLAPLVAAAGFTIRK